MNDWTSGYVADIGYTYGYYSELNPLRIRLAFLNAGLVCPEIGTACELGFGQGLSVNLHAAASVVQWHGTDFNPSQASFAQDLAKSSGANIQVFDQAFAEFTQRGDLPDFDFIALHGIWSWINDENRAFIVDFIRRKLKVGGVLYISYNTLPGWASFAPMRHLLTQHAEVIGSEGRGIVSRIDGAVNFAEKLLATNPTYSRANPSVAERIKNIKGQNRHYLAHEYFNRDWMPMHFATMADWLEPAKVSFACSAFYVDHVEGINLTPEQQAFLNEVPDRMFRESVRDFMTNQQFRRDYWVKGPRRLNMLTQGDGFRQQRLILTSHRPNVPMKVQGSLGEAAMHPEIYAPILDVMADHKVRSIAQIEQALPKGSIGFGQLVQALLILVGAGHLSPVQDDQEIQRVKKASDKLNAKLTNNSLANGDVSHLASPLTGGGVFVARFSQIFLIARSTGKKLPREWAEYAWAVLSAQHQKLAKEGQALETPEENLAELTSQAEQFAATELPILKALQIA